MNKQIRLRYAPSPTGYLHIGNTRTALFNYLFAKHYEGKFIIRIEDTDVERNVEGAIDSQLDNLRWLGIIPDETIDVPGEYGPYRQLERLELYQKYAEQLLAEKKAYRCFCTAAELEKSREFQLSQGYASPRYDRKCYRLTDDEVKALIAEKKEFNIRFYVPSATTYEFEDLVRGTVRFESKDIGDWVILKSNKIPTYNFAVVVDDFLMKISHVVRGEEHISNTPKQLMIYEALQAEPPVFAHLTLIVNEQHKKLSKRDGNVMQFISQYRELGYLPEAIFNFISLLGWSPKEEREIFSKDELIKIFDETRWSKSPSMFDVKKLTWINNHYIKQLNSEEYIEFVRPFLSSKYDISKRPTEWLNMLLLIFHKELNYGAQINDLVKPFFEPIQALDQEAEGIFTSFGDKHLNLVKMFLTELNDLDSWDEQNIKTSISALGKKLELKGKDLFMPIRIACSYQSHGPELAKVIYLLGKEQVTNNIKNLLKIMVSKEKTLIIRDSVYGDIEVKDKVAVDIINSKEFQRLRRISQIAGGQFVFPSANHTRFMHSIGVYHLVKRILNKDGFKGYNPKQKLIVRLAGLLHDIGHGPFSHSFEVNSELQRLDEDKDKISNNKHEDYSVQIIKDKNTDINKVLKAHNFDEKDIENICQLIIGGHEDEILSSLVSSQLDADRMDYLLRDGFSSGVSYSHLDCDWIIRQMKIDNEEKKIVFPFKTIFAIESYLIGRYHMYKQIYLHPISIGFDSTLKSFLQRIYDLIKSNYNFINIDIINNIKSLIEYNVMSASEYCKLDDFTFFYYIKKLGEEDDFVLKKLSDMLVNRKFLRRFDDNIMSQEDLQTNLDTYLAENLKEKDKNLKEKYYNYFKVKYTYKPVYIYETKKIPIYIEINKEYKKLDEVSELIQAISMGKKNNELDKYKPSNSTTDYYTLKELMKR